MTAANTEKEYTQHNMNIDVCKRPMYGVTNERIIGNAAYQKLIGSIAGIPGYDLIGAIGTFDQVMKDNTAQTQMITTWPCSYFNMNPYVIPGGTAQTAPYVDATNPQMDRIGISYVRHDFQFTNTATITANVEIYAFMCKEDTGYDPIVLIDNLDDQYRLGAALALPPNAGQLTTGYQQGHTVKDLPGGTFFIAPGFSRYYKVVGKHKFTLTGGASHKLVVHTKYGKVFSKEIGQMSDNQTLRAGLKNKTIYFVARTLGVPVTDTTTVGNALFTYGSTSIGCVVNVQKYFKLMMGNQSKMNLNVSWSRVPKGAALSAQKIIDADDDAVSAVKVN